MVEILEFNLGLDCFMVRWRNPLHGKEHDETYRFRLSPTRKQLSVATGSFPPKSVPPDLQAALESAGHWQTVQDTLIRQELDALAKQFGETTLEKIVRARHEEARETHLRRR